MPGGVLPPKIKLDVLETPELPPESLLVFTSETSVQDDPSQVSTLDILEGPGA